MKAILVDDEPDGIRTLKKLLELHCPQVQVTGICSNVFWQKSRYYSVHSGCCFPGYTNAR